MVPKLETFITDGVTMKYEVTGEGPVLVLMHGWGCDHSTVRSIANWANECGYKVFNIDFPGFGSSDEPDDVWGVEDYTRYIEEFIKQKGLQDVTLVGHSFGGRVGILYSSRNKVKKLILVDAAGIKPKRGVNYYFKVYSYKLSRKLWYLLLGAKKAEKRAEDLRRKRGSADYAMASPMMRRILSKVVNEDLKYALKGITAPTLLMWGVNDTATPIRDAELMEKLIPDAGLVRFEDAGHYSFLDRPAHFSAVLKNFLSQC